MGILEVYFILMLTIQHLIIALLLTMFQEEEVPFLLEEVRHSIIVHLRTIVAIKEGQFMLARLTKGIQEN